MLSVNHIIATGGLLAVGLIVFAESGLLIGFFLPGDTLLFSAGIFASQGKLPLIPLLVTVVLSAIIGYQVGYIIGERAGPILFKRKGSWLFDREYVDRAQAFFDKHGGKAIIMARFVAIVRTLVSVLAGIGKMDRRRYFIYNVIGATLWGISVTLLGFWLGKSVPNIDHYILPVVLLAVVLTAGGPIIHLLRQKRVRDHLLKSLKLK